MVSLFIFNSIFATRGLNLCLHRKDSILCVGKYKDSLFIIPDHLRRDTIGYSLRLMDGNSIRIGFALFHLAYLPIDG